MIIETQSQLFAPTNTTDSTAAAYVNPLATITQPAGSGVVVMGNEGSVTSNSLQLMPYGSGSATNTFNMHVFGWKQTPPAFGAFQGVALWVPFLLAQFLCTLCTTPGIAGTIVGSGELFCDTISLVVGNANVSVETLSPTGNILAHILLDCKGSKFVSFVFDMNSSATSANCLYSKV